MTHVKFSWEKFIICTLVDGKVSYVYPHGGSLYFKFIDCIAKDHVTMLVH